MTLGTNSKQVKELIKLYSSGNLNKAEYRARKLIKQYHDAFILFNVLGAILNDKKKFDEAIKNFKQAIKINPNYAQAENNLGVAYQNLNKFNESISCYKRAIKLKSDYAEPCNNLGVVLKNLGKFNYSRVIDHWCPHFPIPENAKHILPNIISFSWNNNS